MQILRFQHIARLFKWLQARVNARTRVLLSLLLVATVIALELIQWRPVNNADSVLLDVFARNSPLFPVDDRLVFVAVDDASRTLNEIDLKAMMEDSPHSRHSRDTLQLMAKQWPWPRSIYARAIRRLLESGAAVVALDVEFPEEGPGDDELAAVIKQYPERILLAATLVRSPAELHGDVWELRSPSVSILPDRHAGDARVALANVWPDEDGVIRATRYRANIAVLNNLPPALVAEFPDEQAISARMAEMLGARVPSDYNVRRFRYSPAARDTIFRPRPIYQLFEPHLWKSNFDNGELVRGKAVIIGASSYILKDVHATPLGIMQGAELHLHQTNALLKNLFVTEPPLWVRIGLIPLAGLLGWLPRLVLRRPILQVYIVILFGTAWFYAAQLLFEHGSYSLPVVLPILALVLVGIDGFAGTYARELRLSRRMRGTFERYVGHGVVSELLDHPADYLKTLGGVTREVTVLFSDLRNFTVATANLDAHELVLQLNEYFTEMVDCVFKNEGTLDKFMGDAVMAVWGNVRSAGLAEDARRATRCALAMREATARLNARWKKEGRVQLDVGIALNHGPVVVGNIGAPSRMDFTVIGNAVNTAWRLQERSKLHPGEILVSEAVANLITPEFATQQLGELLFSSGTLKFFRIADIKSQGQP